VLKLLREQSVSIEEKVWRLQQENNALLSEVEQRRLAEKLARDQSAMLIQSLDFLANESHLDTFLGHVLKTTVDQLEAVGGTLWFPDHASGTARLHLEYLDGQIIPARQSHHPAVLLPPPIGGVPLSTFPGKSAETYMLCYEVAGMPEQNRAYIMSLGVKTLLTVPMVLGNETVGWICIRSNRMDHDNMKSQIRVAEALAGQATLAMQMARLSERARQAAVLEERNRIARDIHDTLAQGFTGVVVNLEASSRALKKDDADLASIHIDHARELAQAGLEEARNSVRALRPNSSHACISTELASLVRTLQDTGAVQARYVCVGHKRLVPPDIRTEILRIAQESTTNILKHAQAKAVLVEMVFEPDTLCLTVNDDGTGFDFNAHHDGFGLIGMQERALRIGAALSVDGVPGKGTRIFLSVPMTNHA
jgi:signal transduction histidine kinase